MIGSAFRKLGAHPVAIVVPHFRGVIRISYLSKVARYNKEARLLEEEVTITVVPHRSSHIYAPEDMTQPAKGGRLRMVDVVLDTARKVVPNLIVVAVGIYSDYEGLC
ncbi:hypothetical protein HAX54_022562 [Datura stramonium]|uniref:Uncharacterized protein n=1 Tax=Datura stramonium TaxID=4076 RepID=A0ABS8UWE8_DATST|nr:hypothetical protein [Datura stramonium]